MKEWQDAWKRVLDFSGRSRRKEYFAFHLFGFCVCFVSAAAFGFYLAAHDRMALLPEVAQAIQTAYAGIVFVPGLAVTVRRFHDTGTSGWTFLLALVPQFFAFSASLFLASAVACLGYFIVLVFRRGDAGPNRYGADPHGAQYGSTAAGGWMCFLCTCLAVCAAAAWLVAER